MKDRLSRSPIMYRLARGAFWSTVGGVVSRIFTVVAAIIVARLVGKEGYGEIGMVQSTVGMFGVFAGFGLGSTATKYIAEFRRKDPEKTGRISSLTLVFSLLSSAALSLICLAASPWLARSTLNRPGLISLLAPGSILLFMSTLGGVLTSALSGYEAFRKIAKINVIQGAAAPVIALPLVWYFGTGGAIASYTVNSALGVIMCARALKHEAGRHNSPIRFDGSIWREWPIIWRFAFPAMASGLIVMPAAWITNVILVNRPGGYGQFGIFSAANQWRTAIIFLPNLLRAAVLPVLSESHGRDKEDFKRAIILDLRATWVIALPLTVIVITMGKPLAALFGRQFHGAAPVIAVLMISVFLNVVNGAVGAALAGSGRMWTGMFMNVGWAVALILSSLLLVPRMGAMGLAAAYLAAYLLHTFWQMAYVELKLARFSISTQWKLILFSMLLFSLCGGMVAIGSKQYVYYVFLIILSLVPSINIIWRKLPKYVPE